MSFTQAIRSGFANYFNFRSRAMASEFWWWQLFMLLSAIAAGMLDAFVDLDKVSIVDLWSLATLLPSIAVAVRRFHDLDMSGWWLFALFIPMLGLGLLVVWFIGEGSPGYNRFGPNPKPRDVSLHALGRSLHRAQTNTTN